MSDTKEDRRANARTGDLHENIRSADKRTRHANLYSAKAQPAAEDEVGDFLWGLIRLTKPDWVLETGTAFGHTAERIASALRENGVGQLLTMEPKGTRYKKAKIRLEGLPVTLLQKEFQDVTPPDGTSFGLCFFDATRHIRDEEYRHFLPWIARDAVMVFHDTGAQHPGMAGVRKLEDAGLIRSFFIPSPRGVSVAVRADSDDKLPAEDRS